MNLREEPGWAGVFTREQADGCYPNGSRVEKTIEEKGDAHPVGARGTVLGSISHPDVGTAYFIEWDDTPRMAVATVAAKIGPLAKQWYRIEAPDFTAGLRFNADQRVDHGAPMLRWTEGKTLAWMLDYCARKGWKMEALRE